MLTTALVLSVSSVYADPRLPLRVSDSRGVEAVDDSGLSKTLEYNFSPEDRARLRKALSDYARNTDPDHQQMLQKRKAMHDSIALRFNECNRDNDDSLDREETTLCLPQVARHFSFVDIDGDGVITLEELELAQTKMAERQRAAEDRSAAQRAAASVEADGDARNKAKSKAPTVLPAASSANSSNKDLTTARKRPG